MFAYGNFIYKCFTVNNTLAPLNCVPKRVVEHTNSWLSDEVHGRKKRRQLERRYEAFGLKSAFSILYKIKEVKISNEMCTVYLLTFTYMLKLMVLGPADLDLQPDG